MIVSSFAHFIAISNHHMTPASAYQRWMHNRQMKCLLAMSLQDKKLIYTSFSPQQEKAGLLQICTTFTNTGLVSKISNQYHSYEWLEVCNAFFSNQQSQITRGLWVHMIHTAALRRHELLTSMQHNTSKYTAVATQTKNVLLHTSRGLVIIIGCVWQFVHRGLLQPVGWVRLWSRVTGLRRRASRHQHCSCI